MKSVNHTIWLGSFLSLYNEKLEVNGKAIVIFEALRFITEKLNNRSDLPFGWKFKLRKPVSVSSTVNGNLRVMQYFHSCFYSNVLFSIGSTETSVTDQLERITETFHAPVISLSPTSERREARKEFEIQQNIPTTFEYSYQVKTSNWYRYTAFRDLIVRLQWNFITLVFSRTYINLQQDLLGILKSTTNVCVKGTLLLSEIIDELHPESKDLELKDKIVAISEDSRMRVLILQTSPVDSRRILKILKELGLEGRFFLIFTTTPMDIDIARGYETVAEGSISFVEKEEENTEFRDYFLRLNPTIEKSFHFHQYWEQVFQCNLNSEVLERNKKLFPRGNYSRNCSGVEKFSAAHGYYPTLPTTGLMNAVKLASFVLKEVSTVYTYPCKDLEGDQGAVEDNTWLRKCPWNEIRSLRQTFNHHLYEYSRSGRDLIFFWEHSASSPITILINNFRKTTDGFRNVEVGNWTISRKYWKTKENLRNNPAKLLLDTSHIVWGRDMARGVTPSGNCSEKCQPGYIQVDSDYYRCCWKCHACPRNNIVVKNKCVPCRLDEKPNGNYCQALPSVYIELNKHYGIILICLSIIGLLFVVFIVSVFIKHNDKHIVRASGRDLSYSMLAGSALLFSCPFLYLKRPDTIICVLRSTLPSLSLFVIFAAILMKYVRLFRIFIRTRTKPTVARPSLISPASQVIIILVLAVAQGTLTGGWFFETGSYTEKYLSENKLFVTLHCVGDNNQSKFVINCSLAYACVLASSFFAYFVRNKLPQNYNESKYTGITCAFSGIILLVFSLSYVLTPRSDHYYHEIALCFLFNAIGFIVIFCHFAWRILIILQGKPFEECHDSLRSRGQSVTPKGSYSME